MEPVERGQFRTWTVLAVAVLIGLVLAVGLLLGVFSGVDDRYRYNGTDFETFPLPDTTTPSP